MCSLPPSLGRIHPVFHISRLLPWTDNDNDLFPNRPTAPQTTPVALKSVTPTADAITSVRLGYDKKLRPSVMFLVQWSATSGRDPSWEPLDNVRHLSALRVYWDPPAGQVSSYPTAMSGLG